MRFAIFLTDRCFGAGIHSTVDAMIASNYALHKSGLDHLFEWDLVGLSKDPVTPTNGLQIPPDYDLETYLTLDRKPDVWLFPAVFHSFSDVSKAKRVVESLQPMIPVARQHHDQGGLLISICSGAFILAEAGLLDNRPALMHWKTEPLFQRMYPKITIDTHKTVADYGNIICTIGGGMAYDYLVLHLVRRFAGHHTAVDAAKLMMINLNPPSPSLFRGSEVGQPQKDKLVTRVSNYLDNNSHKEIVFSELAAEFNLSERQLSRRFNSILNCSPHQYLQRTRIQHACHLLEATNLASSKIVYQVGYQDESSFRRLFKKHLGATMEQYRRQFGREHLPSLETAQ